MLLVVASQQRGVEVWESRNQRVPVRTLKQLFGAISGVALVEALHSSL